MLRHQLGRPLLVTWVVTVLHLLLHVLSHMVLLHLELVDLVKCLLLLQLQMLRHPWRTTHRHKATLNLQKVGSC